MKIHVKWWGHNVPKYIRVIMRRRLGKLGLQLKTDIQQSISTLFPPASDPGRPPHMRSGTLHDALQYRVRSTKNTESVNVGYGLRGATKAYYAYFLEKGTSKMAARPFMRPALLRFASVMEKTIGASINAEIRTKLRSEGHV